MFFCYYFFFLFKKHSLCLALLWRIVGLFYRTDQYWKCGEFCPLVPNQQKCNYLSSEFLQPRGLLLQEVDIKMERQWVGVIQCEKLQGVVSLSALLLRGLNSPCLFFVFICMSLRPVNKLFQSNSFLRSIMYTIWLQIPSKPCGQKLLLVLLFYFLLLKIISVDMHRLNFMSFMSLVRCFFFPLVTTLPKTVFFPV